LQGVARLAVETPRQIANAHTVFSVSSTLILLWFVGPLARLAQIIVPPRRQKTKSADEPLYLDESSLTIPSVGLQRITLELGRLGELVLAMVRRSFAVIGAGRLEDLQAVIDRCDEIDRLQYAILVYVGRLSEMQHSEEEGQRLVGLAQAADHLQSVSDIVKTNLVSLGQQRVAEGIDLKRLRDENTAQFAETVVQNLEQAIGTISQPNASEAEQVIEAKKVVEELAATARKNILDKLLLSDEKDLLSFRLTSGLIEYSKQIAYFARRIAEITQEW
jgi:phosphate:Na+ symporter